MPNIVDTAKSAFARGERDVKSGYLDQSPVDFSNVDMDSMSSELKAIKQESINRYTGKQDYSLLDKRFTEVISNYAYRAGVQKARNKKYPTPGLILKTAKDVYKS